MRGGFSVDGVHTLHDLGYELKSKSISPPAKKSVRVTVPYMNGSYDFSDVYGDLYFEDRELSYLFDIIGDPVEVDIDVSRLIDWAASIQESDIHDDDRPDYHYRGSFTGAEVERDDSGELATVTLTFTVYPFAIANDLCVARLKVGDNTVVNHGHQASLTVIPDDEMTIQIGQVRQTFMGKTVADFALGHGENTLTVTDGGGTVEWSEEVI